jgi:hypothetical protein
VAERACRSSVVTAWSDAISGAGERGAAGGDIASCAVCGRLVCLGVHTPSLPAALSWPLVTGAVSRAGSRESERSRHLFGFGQA